MVSAFVLADTILDGVGSGVFYMRPFLTATTWFQWIFNKEWRVYVKERLINEGYSIMLCKAKEYHVQYLTLLVSLCYLMV